MARGNNICKLSCYESRHIESQQTVSQTVFVNGTAADVVMHKIINCWSTHSDHWAPQSEIVTWYRWDAAALREDRGSIQKGERAQVDWSIQNRQRGLEGGELWVFTGERGGQEERWGAINPGGTKGGVEPWVATGGGGHVTYRECQKNQSADRGITSVDGCGEFMSAG